MSQPEPPASPSTESGVLSDAPEAQFEINACWSESGVYGNNSCVELLRFFHCRNCPVYSAAGARLIDRQLPDNYRKEWAQHFAAERRLPDSGNASIILFRIQSDWLALPTEGFQEVAERRPIHSLPHRQEGMLLGLANVRGELVTCVSLGHVLQISGIPSLASLRSNYARLMVLQWESNRLAFPVDEVRGPHRFPSTVLTTTSSGLGPKPHFVQAIVKLPEHSAGLLDTGTLFANLERTLA